jgi:Family of unknown function (DUF6615)
VLCHIAHKFPNVVEDFLERDRRLRRRFREETVTDVLMGCFISAGGQFITVEFPDEPVTGADMEWNFVNRDDGTFFRILLQAKRCYGDGKFWSRHCYRELLHRPNPRANLQAQTLCDTARKGRATYPLYIFYNAAHTCELARSAGAHAVTGVTLASGHTIEQLAKSANTRTLRTSNKSVGTIAPSFFSMADLFCPPSVLPTGPLAFAPRHGMAFLASGLSAAGIPTIGVPMPPTPHMVRTRLAEAVAALTPILQEPPAEAAPQVPEITNEMPDEVAKALGDYSPRKPSPLKHWRVTFVSANPPDDDLQRVGPDRPVRG